MNNVKRYSIVFCFFCLCSVSGFSQETITANDLQVLLAERRQLAENNASYTELERTAVSSGHVIPALATKTDVSGKTRFEFTTYRNVRPDREAAIAERIKSSVPSIESIVISNQKVTALFKETATIEDIHEFFRLTGYNSYEIKNN